MNTVRITDGELQVGIALPWKVYTLEGKLLLNEGHVFRNDRQLGMMVSKGLYREAPDQRKPEAPEQSKPEAPKQREPVTEETKPATNAERACPFDVINAIPVRLRAALDGIRQNGSPDALEEVRQLSRQVQGVCEHDSDAALGAVHLWYHDSYPIAHSIHVSLLTELLLRRLGEEPARRLSAVSGALTSNLAMIDLQDELSKQAEPLTEAQRQEIYQHPVKGHRLLKEAGVTDEHWLDVVLHHHERLDGKGYNEHLSGDQISTESKIVMLADIYGAMITPRVYREGLLAKDALREIFLKRGSEVDEQLAVVFIKELGVFPPGSLVELSNGEKAVVVKRGINGTAPHVMSILNSKGKSYVEPIDRQCDQVKLTVKAMVPREPNVCLNLRMLWHYA